MSLGLSEFSTTGAENGINMDMLADVTGDGVDEILLGIPGDAVQTGKVELRDGQSGAVLFTHLGTSPWDQAGKEVVALGDLTGDGVADYAFASTLSTTPVTSAQGRPPGQRGGDGWVRFVSGATGAVFDEMVGTGAAEIGMVMTRLDDLDRDGVDDLALTSLPQSGPVRRHEVHVLSGADRSSLGTIDLGSLSAFAGGYWVYYGLADAGDVDGDGYGDIVVSRAYKETPGPAPVPFVRIYSGRDLTLQTDIASPSGHPGFGITVAGVRDVDGDGYDDVGVGNPDAGFGVGEVHVFARTGFLLDTFTGPGPSDFGRALAPTPHWSGLGSNDVAIGAPTYRGTGAVYVYASSAAIRGGFIFDQGPGLAGTGNLVPKLRGRGSLTGWGTLDLTTHKVRPGAGGFLLLSIASQPVNIFGGTIYTRMPVPVIPLVADANGDAHLRVTVPPGLAGLGAVLQSIFFDSAAPRGLSFSNGMRIYYP